jgi:hypothetical protein
MSELPILIAAAFAAGMLNTLAGGGTFLTFPALVLTGMPPVAANATSAVAVLPGYAGGMAGYRRELGALPRGRLLRQTATALAGGLTGAGLLLITPDTAFARIVPLLMLLATLAFTFGDTIRSRLAAAAGAAPLANTAGLFLVCSYGGYFNGGLGIMLLALFALQGMSDLHAMNGLKTAVSLIVSAISVAAFALAGLVAWTPALVMMAAATAGGYLGAPFARALPVRVVRGIVIATGIVMTAVFTLRALA